MSALGSALFQGGDTASEFAMQGADAHSLCEHAEKKPHRVRSRKTPRRICSISMKKWQTAPMATPSMMEYQVAKEKMQ